MPLRKIVTNQKVAEALNALPDASSEIMDKYYPASVRSNHPFASISLEEIQQIVKAVPVVLRGGMPVNIGGESTSISFIEPQAIDIIDSISAVTLNNIKDRDGTTQQAWLADRMLFARNTIRATTEALSIQSLSGKISFSMKTDAGMSVYEIDFGNVLSFVPGSKLNAAGADISTVLSILRGMHNKIKKAGGGTKVAFEASADVFDKIVSMAGTAKDSNIKIEIKTNQIIIAGYEINAFVAEYYDPTTKDYKTGVAEKTLKCIATDGGFAFRYLALDDIDAGLQALPLFAKAIKRELPSGWIINTKSKPLPIPNPNSICDAVVL